jgi:hypothetical protein
VSERNAPDDLSSIIHWPREERNLEFKRSMDWADPTTKAKLTKSVLAMANVRDGGHIVLGVERQPDDSYIPVGMKSGHLNSFVQDHLSSYFSEYADPYVETTLLKHDINGRTFCVIRVSEFAELPVVCKKDGQEKLRRGATYTRSRRMPETVEVPSHVEMREILDLAIEKRGRAFAQQAERMGMVRSPQRGEFEEQLKTVPETEILRKIWSLGRWRVRIKPTVFEKARFQNLTACRLFALSHAVNSRDGLQYPLANNENIQDGAEWVEGEADLTAVFPHVERWTLFRSGQFVHNFAIAEEFLGTAAWPVHPQFFIPGQGKRYLNIFRTLKIVTCIYEFAARMASRDVLAPAAQILVELHGTDGRELSYMTPKHRTDERYWCRKESIEIDRLVRPEDLVARARELALDATAEIFQEFGWVNPPRTLFAEEQARVLDS